MAEYLSENHPLYQDGFFYGLGAFETLKVQNRKIYYWHSHLNRLFRTARFLGFQLEPRAFRPDEILDKIPDHKVYRLNLYTAPALAAFKITPYIPHKPGSPLLLGLSSVKRSPSILYRHKTLNYLEPLLLKRAAAEKGLDDVLIVEQRGRVCESAASNIFWEKDGTVYTPSSRLPLLNGIMRRAFLRHLRKLGICVKTGFFDLEEIERADKIWLSNSMQGVRRAKWSGRLVSI